MKDKKMQDFGLLIFRVTFGIMFLIHGIARLSQVGTVEATRFLSFFGLSPQNFHFIVACTESLGALFLLFGIFTQFSALVLASMIIATFFGEASNIYLPGKFFPENELFPAFEEYILLYLFAFISFIFTGAGYYSIDEKFRKRLPSFFKSIATKVNAEYLNNLGLLISRVTFGVLMFVHNGLPKLLQIGKIEATTYFSLFGISPSYFHFITACTEGLGSLLLIFGVFTRFSSMAMVIVIVSGFIGLATSALLPADEHLIAYKEYTYLFITVFISFVFTGPGRFSIDEKIKRR